jgi:hypothetical protein
MIYIKLYFHLEENKNFIQLILLRIKLTFSQLKTIKFIQMYRGLVLQSHRKIIYF